MIVTQKNISEALGILEKQKTLALDTETTSIHWWDSKNIPVKPRVFSIQLSTETQDFYFDFEHSFDKLTDIDFPMIQRAIFDDPEKLFYIHNAKFDMHQMANHGLDIKGTIHCTKSVARILNNTEEKLNLDDLCEKYLGANKMDVKTYIMEHRLFDEYDRYGETVQHLRFDRLPLAMSVEYGERDTRLCYKLGQFQLLKAQEIEDKIFRSKASTHFGKYSLFDTLNMEYQLTKTLFRMERHGIRLDQDYCHNALEYDRAEARRYEAELDSLASQHLQTKIDWLSPKQLKPLFDALKEPYSYTEKGNASFDKDALEESKSEVAKLILKYRYHHKRARTYFENLLWLSDSNGRIHCDFQQNGTQQVRMSCWSPNLQNVPKRADKQESQYPVRRAFIPSPGKVLVSADWDQMEYRLMLDYAGEVGVIDQIKQGLDPHQELASKMNLTRDTAKTMQFRILYGAGGAAIGKALGTSSEVGLAKKKEYFQKLPNVARLISNIKQTADIRGFIYTWTGRPLVYDRASSYRAPNGLIQGGCGEAMKIALNRIDTLLAPSNSRLMLSIHDEAVSEFDPKDFTLIKDKATIMESVYPHKLIQLTAGVAHSNKSWADLTDGAP